MAAATFLSACPCLPVRDVAAAVAYYARAFGMRPLFLGNMPHYAHIGRDGIALGLAIDPDGSLAGRGHCYFTVSDLDAIHRDCRAAGAVIIDEPAMRNYGGRDFVVADPDGNRIAIGQG